MKISHILLSTLFIFHFSCHSPKKIKSKNNLEPTFDISRKVSIDKTIIQGKLIERLSSAPVIFGTIVLFKNDTIIATTETDFNGDYCFSKLVPDNYDIEFSYIGFPSYRITGVEVNPNSICIINAQLAQGIDLKNVEVISYTIPIICPDDFTKGRTYNSYDIRRSPTSKNN